MEKKKNDVSVHHVGLKMLQTKIMALTLSILG